MEYRSNGVLKYWSEWMTWSLIDFNWLLYFFYPPLQYSNDAPGARFEVNL